MENRPGGPQGQDILLQSSVGGGSRFLKKAPQTTASSSHEPESRFLSSSQRRSQSAVFSRLAQIESRLRARVQAQEQTDSGSKPLQDLTIDQDLSPPAARPLEAPVELSGQSSRDQDLGGKRFLKKKAAVAVNSSGSAAGSSTGGPYGGSRSRSRAADADTPPAHLKTRSRGIVSGVSPDSDEEDMKKLLGDSPESMENSLSIPKRPSSRRPADQILSRSSPKASTPPAAAPPLSPAPPHSPGSLSHRGSPFRFSGRAKAHFSPSVLSPSPPPKGLESSLSEVMSLEDLCPVRSVSEDPHSEISAASSEDFKINVMSLDDLAPVYLRDTSEGSGPKPGQSEAGHSDPQQHTEEDMQEDTVNYESDFESGSRIQTDPDHSASQVSEHIQEQGEDQEVVSEVRTAGSEDDYSSSFSDTSRSYSSRSADRSPSVSGSRARRYSSEDSRSLRPGRRRKVLKEEAVQTQPDLLAFTAPASVPLGPAVSVAFTHPSLEVHPALRTEMVEALSSFSPAASTLKEVLRQQLAMTRTFIQNQRQLHLRLLQSLEPPDYRYTTLEDTKELIRKMRLARSTEEKAEGAEGLTAEH